jgi:hypothetical protein
MGGMARLAELQERSAAKAAQRISVGKADSSKLRWPR